MGRIYEELECRCLISCDGGGGIIPVCGKVNNSGVWFESKDCKVKEYMDKHNVWCGGYCKVCHPYKFYLAIQKGEKIYYE